jgi:hypothetical protein
VGNIPKLPLLGLQSNPKMKLRFRAGKPSLRRKNVIKKTSSAEKVALMKSIFSIIVSVFNSLT